MARIVACSIFIAGCGGGGGDDSPPPPPPDADGDAIRDAVDNCVDVANAAQADQDSDNIGDACDVDRNNDGLIEITTLEQLDWMRNDLNGASRTADNGLRITTGCPVSGCAGYSLAADLDFDTNGDGVMDANDTYFDYDGDGSNSGWLPVGDGLIAFGATFSGSTDGTRYSINNLYIDRDGSDAETLGMNIGLFGRVTTRAMGPEAGIVDVRLAGPLTEVSGNTNVGALAGSLEIGGGEIVQIANNSVSAVVRGDTNVGGHIGFVEEWMPGVLHYRTNSMAGFVESFSAVPGTDLGGIGGHIGWLAVSEARISELTSTASIMASDDQQVGGLIGYIASYEIVEILDSAASGPVLAYRSAGGLVGVAGTQGNNADLIIRTSSNTGLISVFDSPAGGLAGSIQHNADSGNVEISDVLSTGDVTASRNAGGLIGFSVAGDPFNRIRLSTCFATGDVLADGSATGVASTAGGLIGLAERTDIQACFSSGAVNGVSSIGGIAGLLNDSSVEASYTASDMTAIGPRVGAFVGRSVDSAYLSNHYETDGSGRPAVEDLTGSDPGTEILGASLATLQEPTVPDTTIMGDMYYVSWGAYMNADSAAAWDFGATDSLPGITIDGATYFDEDGDGELDTVVMP